MMYFDASEVKVRVRVRGNLFKDQMLPQQECNIMSILHNLLCPTQYDIIVNVH